jgi:hypothetical protein
VGITIEVVDPAGVELARTPYEAMDLVALVQQKFGEVGAILAGDPGDEGAGHGR